MISSMSFNTVPSTGILWYNDYTSYVSSNSSIVVDYQNNTYQAGHNGTDTYIFKYTSSGILTWQRKLAAVLGTKMVLDGPGDLYLVGTVPAGTAVVLVKYTQAGAVSWQKNLGTVSNSAGYSIAFNKFNYNIVIAGKQNNNGLLAAFDTSGNILWQKEVVGNTIDDLVVDHVTGSIFVQFINGNISKYTAEGTLVKTIGLSLINRVLTAKKLVIGSDGLLRSLCVDSSGQLYDPIHGNFYVKAPYADNFAKIFTVDLNLNVVSEIIVHCDLATFSWYGQVGTVVNGYFNDIAIDSANNIYLVGSGPYGKDNVSDTPVEAIILKINSANSLVWSRKFGAPDLENLYVTTGLDNNYVISQLNSVYIDQSDNLYIAGTTREIPSTTFLAKFTGTGAETNNYDYNNYYLNTDAYTIASVSEGEFTVNNTINTTSYTATTSTYVSSTSTIAVNRLTVPLTVSTYWANSYNNINNITDIGVDSTDNTYSLVSVGTNWDILKTNSASVSQWQYRIAVPYLSSLAVSAAGDVIAVGYIGSGATQKAFIIKLNTSGVVQWQFSYGPGLAGDTFYKVCLDTSGNVYATGVRNTDCVTVKFTSAGAITWQKVLTAAGLQAGTGIGVDSSSNVYVLTDTVLVKYSSAGAVTWQKTATDDYGYANPLVWSKLAVSTTGDCYITGSATNVTYLSGSAAPALFKFNTSGVLSYVMSFISNENSNNFFLNNITLDTSNNAYIVGKEGSIVETQSGNYIPCLVKFSSAGTLLLDRRLYRDYYGIVQAYASGMDKAFNAVAISSTTIMYLAGSDPLYNDVSKSLLLKVPLTGSTVPTIFGRLKYQVASFLSENAVAYYTVSNSTLTLSTPTNTTAVTTATRTLINTTTKYQFNAA